MYLKNCIKIILIVVFLVYNQVNDFKICVCMNNGEKYLVLINNDMKCINIIYTNYNGKCLLTYLLQGCLRISVVRQDDRKAQRTIMFTSCVVQPTHLFAIESFLTTTSGLSTISHPQYYHDGDQHRPQPRPIRPALSLNCSNFVGNYQPRSS